MIIRDNKLILLNQTIAYKKSDLTFVNFTDNLLLVDGIKNEDSILGKRDDELPWNEFANQYHRHDKEALAGKAYTEIVPFGNDVLHTTHVLCSRSKCLLEDGTTGVYINVIPVMDIQLQSFLKQLAKSDPALTENYNIGKNPTDIHLTQKELETLFYILRGKSAKFIAYAMNVSIRTAEFHINNIKIKFVCRTKNELISTAINLGYMSVIPEHLSHQYLHARLTK